MVAAMMTTMAAGCGNKAANNAGSDATAASSTTRATAAEEAAGTETAAIETAGTKTRAMVRYNYSMEPTGRSGYRLACKRV